MIFDFAVYCFIASLCLAYGQYFNEEDDLVNINMKNVLKESTQLNHAYIKNVCQIFIDIFDKFYSDSFKHPSFSNFLWISIFVCWEVVFFTIIGATYQYVGTYQVLLISMFLGPLIALFNVYDSSIGFKKSIPILDDLYDHLIHIIKCKLKIKTSSYNKNKRISLKKCFFASTVWAIVIGMFIILMGLFIQLAPESLVTSDGFLDMPIFHLEYSEFIKVFGFLGITISIISFFPAFYMYIVFSAMEKYKSFFKISPVIVILSSFVTIVLCALVKIDLISTLLKNNHLIFYVFIPFLFLNVLTDSVSILETRYMLGKAMSGSLKKMFLFLFLDLLVSSIIYLIIPILNGDLTLFLNAIIFDGEMAWVGIFYWSSLFTSLFFYLYISGFIILHILCKCSNNKYFVNKPNKWLGIIIFFIVTVVYLVPTNFEFVFPLLLLIIFLMLLSLIIIIKSNRLNFNK